MGLSEIPKDSNGAFVMILRPPTNHHKPSRFWSRLKTSRNTGELERFTKSLSIPKPRGGNILEVREVARVLTSGVLLG
jgi:hypothetical protein